jgi:TPR repeat protein
MVPILLATTPGVVTAGSHDAVIYQAAVSRSLLEQGLSSTTFERGLKAFVAGRHGEAIDLWRPLAETGHVQAQYNLGIAYSRGTGVAPDIHLAIDWWERAGRQGYRDALFNLGLTYSTGFGVPKDESRAAKWWLQAAELGDAVAQYQIGKMYARGEGLPQNTDLAIQWWQKSAASGFDKAARLLDKLAAGNYINKTVVTD